jgi:enoyl-CoA hydratase/carnithine racemase
MSQNPIAVHVTEAICTLSLNHPEKLNAINGKLLAAFCGALLK